MPERPRILIPTPASIDLTYSLQCWPQYAAAVNGAGGDAIAADLALTAAELRSLARTCEGVILPGNLADVSPERYGSNREPECGPLDLARELCDWTLLEHVFATGTPLLSICYGMQSLNVFCGGTLLQDIDAVSVRHTAGPSVGVAHAVLVPMRSGLGRLLDTAETSHAEGDLARVSVNSSHHQAVGIVGEGLRVVARSIGDGMVEAIELTDAETPFLLGVQWHPERTTAISSSSMAIFRHLVRAAGER